ncbi:zinc finger, C3HC4 type (RING finger) protein (macronuclear) [Tetrahymena thermophila SB210]|uniref:Zinc finger, C3HC4 type (RING finger) protein n=1 Tax=Tetrahymena thermophila (strain SB210) TaxID=312017 RepID=Q23D67_TETTS|nr:zinc finger, C3HC4 type (RING finger) protein [Tetrahymena thermophila SB210]EAR94496.2 zinc finger, C3HC4 type (RING finger) protein [Tetrahymena thermophila SB210]|eukprot:XP_001014819.2 zinc finger, C3HC4 type (RING finger) protein [Tetrahymena thermophila SB210]
MKTDKNEKPNQNQINLIDYLNKKQGQNQKNNFEDQDSSLENNLSNNSDQEDDNSQKNQCDFNFDHSENQNTKIHRNQCMKDNNKPNKNRNSSYSSNKKHQSNNKSKITQINKKTTGMNYYRANDRITFKNNIFNGDDDEEEETKDSTEQSEATNNQLSVFTSNEDKQNSDFNQQDQNGKYKSKKGGEEDEEDDDYQTIDDDEAVNYDSNNQQYPSQSNPRSNSEIINESDSLQNQQNQQRSHEGNTLPPRLQSLFPDINQNMISLASPNLNHSRILLTLPFRSRNGFGLSLLDQLNNASQRPRSNRTRRDINSWRQRQNHHQYADIFNDHHSNPLEIQSTESIQTQIKQLTCARISSILIYFFLLYFMRNQNMIFIFVATIILLIIQFYIHIKKKQLVQSRGSQIHENRYFSYRLSDSNNNQINENNQVFENNFDLYDRFPRRAVRSRGLENYIRELNHVLLINTFFSIINQIQQPAAVGYNDQQLNQIGGTYKYSQLKMQLKLEKNQNVDHEQANADTQDLEEDDNQCVVCLEKFCNDVDVRILKCQHYFHQSCVDEWLKKKMECPVCRQCPFNVEAFTEDVSSNAEPNQSNQHNFISPIQIIPSIRTSPFTHQYQIRSNRRPNIEPSLNF